MSKYEVRGVKTHKGHEGEPLAECGLYRDGKKVAVYSDGDWGGEARFWWVDEKDAKVEVKGIDFGGKATSYMGTPEEALLAAHCAAMPEKNDIRLSMKFHTTPDLFVSDLIEAYQSEKRLEKSAKTKTIFVARKNGEEVEFQMNAPYTPEIKAYIESKYGENLVRILNKEFVSSEDAEALKKKKADAKLRKQCQTATLFRLKGEAAGRYWVLRMPYGPEAKARIQAKYGDKLAEIINETMAA